MSDDGRKPADPDKALWGCLLLFLVGVFSWGVVILSVAVVAWIISIFN